MEVCSNPVSKHLYGSDVSRIQKFGGQAEYVLSAEADLTSMTTQKAWSRPPISMDFSLLMFTSSGLLVRYLKVFEKSNYNAVKCK